MNNQIQNNTAVVHDHAHPNGPHVLPNAENFNRINGSNFNDTIYGSYLNDLIYGLDGNDVLAGFGGNDEIEAGDGNDDVYGGYGHDALHGGAGHDVLFGNEGWDSLMGEGGDDWLYGGTGNDSLAGEAGNDVLFGEQGNDALYGGEGHDWLDAGTGNNYMNGGDGFDTVNMSDYFQNYNIANLQEGGFQITHRGTGEQNILDSIEQLQFANGTIDSQSLANYINNVNPPMPQDIPRVNEANPGFGNLNNVQSTFGANYNDINKSLFDQAYLNKYPTNTSGNFVTSQEQFNDFWHGLGNLQPAPTFDFNNSILAFHTKDGNDPNSLRPFYGLSDTGTLFNAAASTLIGFQPSNNAYDILINILPREGINAIDI